MSNINHNHMKNRESNLNWYLITGVVAAYRDDGVVHSIKTALVRAEDAEIATHAFSTRLKLEAGHPSIYRYKVTHSVIISSSPLIEDLDQLPAGIPMYDIAATNDEKPFAAGEVIRFGGEFYLVVENVGDKGVVTPIDDNGEEFDEPNVPFRWVFEGEACVRLFKDLKLTGVTGEVGQVRRFKVNQDFSGMRESPEGEFVLLEDYQRLISFLGGEEAAEFFKGVRRG